MKLAHETPAAAEVAPGPPAALSPGRVALRRARRHGSVIGGGAILLVIVLAALLAPWIATHDPFVQDLARRLIPPVWDPDGSWKHVLGTDGFGRDYLSRLFYGARISLFIGVATVAISGVLGTLLGLAAGYFGGRVDLAVNFLISIRLTLPVVLVALVVVSLVGSSLQIVVLVLGLLLWDRFAIVVRAATQQVAHLDFVVSAQAIGSSTWRIMLSEILPNVTNPLIVVATVEMTHAVLLEAALSFLGLGVQPPSPSWGLMVAESKSFFFFAPWVLLIPSAALFLLVLSVNLLGDGVRDVTATEARF